MSHIKNAITTLKASYQYLSYCSALFKTDRLGSALKKYNNDNPTDKQILDVISVFIMYHRNDPNLAKFAEDIQNTSEHESLTVSRVNQSICALLILNKNGFLPEEYMDAIEKSQQLEALVSCLRVLDNLQCLNKKRFTALLDQTNQRAVLSVLNKLNDATLLNVFNNLDAVLQLPYYANNDADAFFNGIFEFDAQLKALPTETLLTQTLFLTLLDSNQKLYGEVLKRGNNYKPSIPTISTNNRYKFRPHVAPLAVTSTNDGLTQAAMITGFFNR